MGQIHHKYNPTELSKFIPGMDLVLCSLSQSKQEECKCVIWQHCSAFCSSDFRPFTRIPFPIQLFVGSLASCFMPIVLGKRMRLIDSIPWGLCLKKECCLEWKNSNSSTKSPKRKFPSFSFLIHLFSILFDASLFNCPYFCSVLICHPFKIFHFLFFL